MFWECYNMVPRRCLNVRNSQKIKISITPLKKKKERKKSFSAIFSNEIVFSENDSEIAVSVLKTFSENLLRSNNALRPCYNIPKTF